MASVQVSRLTSSDMLRKTNKQTIILGDSELDSHTGARLLKRGVAEGGAWWARTFPPLRTLRLPVRESGVKKRDWTTVLAEVWSSLATSGLRVSLFFSRKWSVS